MPFRSEEELSTAASRGQVMHALAKLYTTHAFLLEDEGQETQVSGNGRSASQLLQDAEKAAEEAVAVLRRARSAWAKKALAGQPSSQKTSEIPKTMPELRDYIQRKYTPRTESWKTNNTREEMSRRLQASVTEMTEDLVRKARMEMGEEPLRPVASPSSTSSEGSGARERKGRWSGRYAPAIDTYLDRAERPRDTYGDTSSSRSRSVPSGERRREGKEAQRTPGRYSSSEDFRRTDSVARDSPWDKVC
jgi:hypothetical protein